MRFLSRSFSSMALAIALLSPLVITGCGGRVYDVDHRDYHRWNRGESDYYVRWEGETHRDHVDFGKRPAADQNAYWAWRHDHK